MPKRLGNTQIPSAAGLSDIINLKQHKQYVEQDIFPSPDNDVLSGLRFDGSSYLTRTPTAAGNRKTWTWSGWMKRSKLGIYNMRIFGVVTGSSTQTEINIDSNDRMFLYEGVTNTYRYDERRLRDTSAWYHTVIAYDTTQSTMDAKIRIYLNGTLSINYTQTGTDITTGLLSAINSQNVHRIGAFISSGYEFNGYLANIHFIDGQALDPSYFGYYNRSSRQWKPKKYTGTYGGNGFYLPLRGASHKSFDYDLVSNYDNVDLSNNNKDVYIAGGTATFVNIFRGSKGKFGNSAYSNRNGKIELSADNAYDLRVVGTTPFTLEAWIKFSEEDGQYPFIMSTGTGDYNAYSAWYNGNVDGYYFTGDTTGGSGWDIDANFSSGNVYDNTWRHIIYSRNTSGQYKLHVNGTYLGIIATNTNNLIVNNLSTKLLSHYSDSTQSGSAYKTPYVYFDSMRLVKGQDLYGTTDIPNYNSDIWNISSTSETYVGSGANLTGTVSFLLPSSQQISPFSEESGNGNNWTPYGFNNHDSSVDSPQNTFATLNALNPNASFLTDGNLGHSGSTDVKIHATLGFSSSIFYFEVVRGSGSGDAEFGVCRLEAGIPTGNWGEDNNAATIWLQTGGVRWQNLTNNVYGAFSDGDVLIVAMDVDAGKLWMGKNGVWFNSGNPAAGTNPIISSMPSGTWTGCIKQYRSGAFNFGQDPTFGGAKSPSTTYTDANGIGSFYYQPPNGALALCTANLSRSVIEDPADYFKTVIWTGDGTGTNRTNSDVGFAADLIWTKKRSAGGAGAAWHQIYDTVRGYNSSLNSNTTNSESTSFDNSDNHGYLDLFTSDGFRFTNGSDASWPRHYYNESGETYVAWCWKAGGAPDLTSSPTKPFAKNGAQYETLSAANITAGTITPTAMSVNTDAGFSIVKYGGSNTTGLLSSSVSSATIPHGLNDCEFCIIKNIRWSNTWVVSHRSIAPNVMSLQDSGQAASTPPVDPAYGQITTLGSNTITITRGSTRGDNVGEDLDAGGGQFEYIMYCWHSVEGYSKCGSYTGNGSADGPFVYCGFRPAFVMIKNTDDSNSWMILDNQRSPHNLSHQAIRAESSGTEITNQATNYGTDILSNGFKPKTSGGATTNSNNATSDTYIFMAFAEQPFNFTNSR